MGLRGLRQAESGRSVSRVWPTRAYWRISHRKPGSYWDLIGYPRDPLAARYYLLFIACFLALGLFGLLFAGRIR